ncbi:MAG: hypothetical protein DME03_19350 [Candidatus Rokuibacteriota bacterium]|nr:MAG: hypothetical protein DME03_19350 [Candidatus Rokubacteria bacterium]
MGRAARAAGPRPRRGTLPLSGSFHPCSRDVRGGVGAAVHPRRPARPPAAAWSPRRLRGVRLSPGRSCCSILAVGVLSRAGAVAGRASRDLGCVRNRGGGGPSATSPHGGHVRARAPGPRRRRPRPGGHPGQHRPVVARRAGLVLCWGLAYGRRPVGRALVVVTWAALFVTLLLTFSRSGLLGAVVAMTVSAIWMSRTGVGRPIAGLGSGLALCAAIMIALFVWATRDHLPTRGELTDLLLRPDGAAERVGLIRGALRLLADHPLAGVGARNFSGATPAITPDRAVLDSVHNVPILIGTELGLTGLALVGVVVAVLVAVGRRRWKARSPNLWQGPVAGGLVALTLISLLDHYPWSVPQGGLLGAWLVGWWLTDDSSDVQQPQLSTQPAPPGPSATHSA